MGRMLFHHSLEVETEEAQYLISCARIRNLAVSSLVHKLMDVILRDQIVSAVLDDDGRPAPRKQGERKFREVGVGG
jgi:hypothetical protein